MSILFNKGKFELKKGDARAILVDGIPRPTPTPTTTPTVTVTPSPTTICECFQYEITNYYTSSKTVYYIGCHGTTTQSIVAVGNGLQTYIDCALDGSVYTLDNECGIGETTNCITWVKANTPCDNACVTPTPTTTLTPTTTPISVTPTTTPTVTNTQTATPTASNGCISCRQYEVTNYYSGAQTVYYVDCNGVESSQSCAGNGLQTYINCAQENTLYVLVDECAIGQTSNCVTWVASSSTCGTICPTSTPSATQTPTPSITASQTPSSTQTPTPTPSITTSQTQTPTNTGTMTQTPTPSITASQTQTPTNTQTATQSPTPSITASQTQTPTPSITASQTQTATNTQTATQTPTPSITSSQTQTPTPSITASQTQTPTNTGTVTQTPTPSITASQTQTPTNTGTVTQTPTPSITASQTQTQTQTPTPSITASQTQTPTPSITASQTQTQTQTPTPSITASQTQTPTPSITASQTPTPSITASQTQTPTPSITASQTQTQTQTPTPSITASQTQTQTQTPTPSITASQTQTPTPSITASQTPTPSITASPTQTPTPSITASPTQTPTPSITASQTQTPTQTPTLTPTPSNTPLFNCATCSGTGWVPYSDTQCVKTTTSSATPPAFTLPLQRVGFTDYSRSGTRIYNAGYTVGGTGTVNTTLLTNGVWYNNVPNSVTGPMNRNAVWFTAYTLTNTWLGFSTCLSSTTTSKTYYIGIGADNEFRLVLDGQVIVDTSYGSMPALDKFWYWNVYPINISAGNHTLELYGLDYGVVAGFGMEVYDNTLAQLTAATSVNDLNIIWSSSGYTSAEIVQDIYGYYLSSGYTCNYPAVYSSCSGGCISYDYCYTVGVTPTPTKTSTPTATKTVTPTRTPTPTQTPTATITPTKTPVYFSDITSDPRPTSPQACAGPFLNPDPTVGNNSTFCNSTTLTNPSYGQLATGTYFIAYGGSFVQVSITNGNNTATVTSSCSVCVTQTPTPTITQTPTNTQTPTPSITASPTNTPTPSITASPTNTRTQTPTPSITASPTQTQTQTQTPTKSPTPSITASPTNTPTPTQSAVGYGYYTTANYGNATDACRLSDLPNGTLYASPGNTTPSIGMKLYTTSFPLSNLFNGQDRYWRLQRGGTVWGVQINTIGEVIAFTDCSTIPSNTPTPTQTPTPSITASPTKTPTQTPTPSPVYFSDITSDPKASGSEACTSIFFNPDPTVGNQSTFCSSTTLTNPSYGAFATGTYYISYGGNYVQVSITNGNNTATVTSSCTVCPTPTSTPTNTPTPTPTPTTPSTYFVDITIYGPTPMTCGQNYTLAALANYNVDTNLDVEVYWIGDLGGDLYGTITIQSGTSCSSITPINNINCLGEFFSSASVTLDPSSFGNQIYQVSGTDTSGNYPC